MQNSISDKEKPLAINQGDNKDIVLPHSDAAECEILGAILQDNNNLNKVREIVSLNDFYIGGNQKIYDTIVKLIDRGKIADVVSLSSNLANDPVFNGIGGAGYLL